MTETRRYFLMNSNNVLIHLFLTGQSARLAAHILEMTSPTICYGEIPNPCACDLSRKSQVRSSKANARARVDQKRHCYVTCVKKNRQWTP